MTWGGVPAKVWTAYQRAQEPEFAPAECNPVAGVIFVALMAALGALVGRAI